MENVRGKDQRFVADCLSSKGWKTLSMFLKESFLNLKSHNFKANCRVSQLPAFYNMPDFRNIIKRLAAGIE